MKHIKEQGLDWILRAAEKEREPGDEGVQDKHRMHGTHATYYTNYQHDT